MRSGLKIRWKKFRAGSSPAARTKFLAQLTSDDAGPFDPLKPSGKVAGAPDVLHTISFEYGSTSNFSVLGVNSLMIMADRRADVRKASCK